MRVPWACYLLHPLVLRTSLFEPIHGSYPQAAGKDIANPMATILSGAMMIESFGMLEEANTIRNAVQYILEKGIGTPELKPSITYGTSKIGDVIAHIVSDEEHSLKAKRK